LNLAPLLFAADSRLQQTKHAADFATGRFLDHAPTVRARRNLLLGGLHLFGLSAELYLG
jgi:hypothetical protein